MEFIVHTEKLLESRAIAFVESNSIEEYYIKRDMMNLNWWSKTFDIIAFRFKHKKLFDFFGSQHIQIFLYFLTISTAFISLFLLKTFTQSSFIMQYFLTCLSGISVNSFAMAYIIMCKEARSVINYAMFLQMMKNIS